MRIEPRSVVKELHAFHPAMPDRTRSELRQMLGREEIVKLSFNESPYGPSPKAVAAIQAAAGQIHCYPDAEGKTLRTQIASFYTLEADMVYLGNGGDETITLVTQGFLSPGEEAIIPQPTFEQYAFAARLAGGIPVRVGRGSDMRTDLPGMLAAVTPRTKMIFLCNPNNPTGMLIRGAELRSFLRQVPEHVMVVLDEAYGEFVTDPAFVSGIQLLAEFPNVLTIRTFSKVYGLAGLRLGYGIARAETVSLLQRVRSPFNVNCLVLAAAISALDDTDFVASVARRNSLERERLTREFTVLGFKVYPSQTNFLFVDLGFDSTGLCGSLARDGIIIRPGTGWQLPTFVRISIGSSEQNSLLLAAVKKALQEK
ncbi:histidinol-phosphate transaminase [Acetonema longum]|uniref:Histidinol-phosphate aminotransferase n=1 Tax=Acetonema longum DSM 6540 TaxID=1009370 RepID=F7NHV9_9FIRM|nr:histidinol-phosphate transaminase [Acetonema longum]EGO64372.1 histidinol-phosphate aminotransferase [Acetonema longum DSM 6540]